MPSVCDSPRSAPRGPSGVVEDGRLSAAGESLTGDEAPPADERAAERKEGFVDVVAHLPADSQAAETVQVGAGCSGTPAGLDDACVPDAGSGAPPSAAAVRSPPTARHRRSTASAEPLRTPDQPFRSDPTTLKIISLGVLNASNDWAVARAEAARIDSSDFEDATAPASSGWPLRVRRRCSRGCRCPGSRSGPRHRSAETGLACARPRPGFRWRSRRRVRGSSAATSRRPARKPGG